MHAWVGGWVRGGGGSGSGGCERGILYQLARGVQPVQTWLPGLPLVPLKPPETLFDQRPPGSVTGEEEEEEEEEEEGVGYGLGWGGEGGGWGWSR